MVLAVGCAATLAGAALSTGSPAMEKLLLGRHHGTDLLSHVVLLPWPSMYSYEHRVVLHPVGPTREGCPTSAQFLSTPHMSYGLLPVVIGMLEECNMERATIELVSRGRWTEQATTIELSRTSSGWTVRW